MQKSLVRNGLVVGIIILLYIEIGFVSAIYVEEEKDNDEKNNRSLYFIFGRNPTIYPKLDLITYTEFFTHYELNIQTYDFFGYCGFLFIFGISTEEPFT